MAPPLTLTVLAALGLSLGRCGQSQSPGPGCDNGKLFLDRDMPSYAVNWDCPRTVWPESTQRLPSIDTAYGPAPASLVCMDQPISYNHTVPNSGAYRPVGAESGEYLYCPPQRWLNNLHHGATVLLYHPCAPLHERLLLSTLARSCLPHYIITSHPQLSQRLPIAFVSWGHTLELNTVASSDVCDWLESTTSTTDMFAGVSQSRKYNLLLTRSAQQHRPQRAHPAKMKESLRRCCDHIVSSPLNGAIEAEREPNMKKESFKEDGKPRQIRAAIQEKQKDAKERENTVTLQTNRTAPSRTGDVHNNNSILGPAAESPVPSLSKTQNVTLGSTQDTALKPTDLRKPNPPAGLDVLADGVNSEHNVRPEDLTLSSKDEGGDRDSLKEVVLKEKKYKTASGTMKDNDVVDVKERELEHTQPPQDPQPASYLPSSHRCEGCTAGQHCECNKDSAALVNKGLPRTPRTDEAVWAAAALGFLLILLTLSVLHTRLYRHWRTTPSLYWHDPQQDYDSVADVIRRRLRIANRRRKRSRRQECVLLPSSSSSDEHP